MKSYPEKLSFHLKISIITFIMTALMSCDDDSVSPPVQPPPSGYRTIDYEPSWSPDGRTIAYLHVDTSFVMTGIYLIDTNGTNKRHLVSGLAGSPDFSPDGNWITYNQGQIFKIKINGDSLTQLTNGGNNYYFPSWSPTDGWIAYDDPIVGSYNIWKTNITGTLSVGICFDARMPSWSPDGSKLTIQKYISNTTFPEICVIDSNGQNLFRLTYNNNDDLYPCYSADGQKIIFTQQHESSINFQIYTINTDGTGLTKLTDTQGYSADYSPDGEKIVYCDCSTNNGYLWIMKKDGSAKRQLTYPN